MPRSEAGTSGSLRPALIVQFQVTGMEGLEFNVSHLLREPVGSKASYQLDSVEPLDLDELRAERITGGVELMRTNFGVLARARLKADVGLECDRCLDPYAAGVRTEFAEEYLPVVDVSTGRPVQSERTDETFFISPNHIVDLTEAVRQHLLLAVPMHALCKEACLGLCPVCGTNRNIKPCECVQEDESPLSAIAELLKNAGQVS